MTVNITAISPATDVQWDAAYRQCPHATYFQGRDWADLWAAYAPDRFRPSGLHVQFDDGATAVWPLTVERACRGLVRQYHASALGTFGGWLGDDRLTVVHARLLVDVLRARAANLVWRTNPYDPLVALANPPGRRAGQTYALDLADGFDAIYATWSRGGWKKGCSAAARTAYKARKAARDGVTIRRAANHDDWRAYYQVYQDTLRRWGERASSRYSWRLFELLADRAGDEVQLWLGEYDGAVIVGEVCFYTPHHAVTWHGAAREAFFKLHPRNLLIVEMVRDACGRGCRWFDFNPSGGHEGVTRFKLSFGCATLPSDVIATESATAQTVRRAVGLLRRALPC